MWMFPKIGVPQIGWFIMENPIKMHDLGGPPLFLETPMFKGEEIFVESCTITHGWRWLENPSHPNF